MKSTGVVALSIAFILLFWGYPCYSQNLGPISTRNQHLPHLVFLNLPPEGAATVAKGKGAIDLNLDYTNTCYCERGGSGEVIIDMEMMRFSPVLRYGAGEGVEIGLEMPFFYFYGGFLDWPIWDFHETFGFSQGDRAKRGKGEVEYLVRKGNRCWLHLTSAEFGPGDLNLFAKLRVLEQRGPYPGLALRSALQIPTGDEEEGMGTGGPVFGLGLILEEQIGNLSLYLNANCHFIDPSRVFPVDRYYLFSGTLAAEYGFREDLSLLLQVNGNSSPFSTGMDLLDGGAAEIIWGLKWKVWKKAILTFGVTEELVGKTSADVTLTTGIRFNF
ncbi:MAG: hypothetical protein DRG32_06195 [Deltaproteobacteria bacterium]|nr:MAG: hypothetical protein DRG32_06195 [Deltaproteobacteria bacterium]